MVRTDRKMTTMGMATAVVGTAIGIKTPSLARGYHPNKQYGPLPPVSLCGEWGELQREKRRGATYGRAKILSDKTSWAKTSILLSQHKRLEFHRTYRPKPKPSHLSNRPIFKTCKPNHDSSSSEIQSETDSPARRTTTKKSLQEDVKLVEQQYKETSTFKEGSESSKEVFTKDFFTKELFTISSESNVSAPSENNSQCTMQEINEELVLTSWSTNYEDLQNEWTYQSPPAASFNPSQSVTAPAPAYYTTPLKLFTPTPPSKSTPKAQEFITYTSKLNPSAEEFLTASSKLNPAAQKFIPPTNLPPTINPNLPTTPPNHSLDPPPQHQKYSPTIPSLYLHETSPYPSSPTVYEAPIAGSPIYIPFTPYPTPPISASNNILLRLGHMGPMRPPGPILQATDQTPET